MLPNDLPTSKRIGNINRNRGKLCAADLDALSGWTWNVTKDQEKMLTHSGRREQRELARRLRERFPGLLDEPFNKDDYLVILSEELGSRDGLSYLPVSVSLN